MSEANKATKMNKGNVSKIFKTSAMSERKFATITKVKKEMPEFIEKANNYIKMMITMKDRIIKNVFHNKDDNMVSLPVSFKYMIDNIKEEYFTINNYFPQAVIRAPMIA